MRPAGRLNRPKQLVHRCPGGRGARQKKMHAWIREKIVTVMKRIDLLNKGVSNLYYSFVHTYANLNAL